MTVSTNSIESGWIKEEYSRAIALTKKNNYEYRLIPAILRDAKLPGFMESRLYVDYRDINKFDEVTDRLVWGVSGRKPTLKESKVEQAIRNSLAYLEKNTRSSQNISLRRSVQITTQSIINHETYIKSWSDNIDILGMTKPKDIDNVYIELALSDDPRKYRLGEISSKRVTISDALNNLNQLVILGDPGAGKTTTIKKLAKSILQNKVKDNKDYSVIVIRLRDFNSSQTLSNCISNLLHISFINKTQSDLVSLTIPKKNEKKKYLKGIPPYIYEVISNLLSKLNITLLIDGFDELPPDNRDQIIAEINDLTRNNLGLGVILTSRPADFSRKPERFILYEVEPLNHTQINKFIELWFSVGENRKRTALDFKQAIIDVPYGDFQERPLTLATLCVVFEKYGALPSLPISIYRKVLNLLLEEWDSERGIYRKFTYGNFDSSRKLDFLAAFAYKVVEKKHSGASFTTQELKDIYMKICIKFDLPANEADKVAEEIESHTGILVKSSYDTFEFSHKSIQEYLVAEHISRLRILPPALSLIQSRPNELAIAIALSSDSCEWFCSLFRSQLTTC